MPDAFIYDHVRTPRGKGRPDGKLHEVPAVQLAVQVLSALKKRSQIPADALDEVILGCVTTAGEQGGTLPRIAPILAGFDDRTPGLHLNRACASALEAVTIAAAKVMTASCDLVMAGGVESMSRVPMGADGGGPHGSDPAVTFQKPFVMQGVSADLLATINGYSRTDLDAYGAESHRRAGHAWKNGYFAKSVIPVHDVVGVTLLDRDEHVRPESTVESLAKLKPAFDVIGPQYGFDALAIQRYPEIDRIEHVHTAGTSSGIVDGACAVLVGSREAGSKLGIAPRARVRSFVSVGSEPTLMLDGPTPACLRALAKAGMTPKDIDLWELNEAFAAVPLRLMQTLGIAHDRMNVNGGAIAMGHPLGATGAMILGTLLDELERRSLSTGVATLCAAGGMGIAIVIERL